MPNVSYLVRSTDAASRFRQACCISTTGRTCQRFASTAAGGSHGSPDEANAIVIGGGVVGTSILYHLAKGGLKNVVLIERSELAKSSWHKPGLISLFHPTHRFKRLCDYSIELYSQLEQETGEKVTFNRPGTIRIATSASRQDEIHHQICRDWSNPRKFKYLKPSEVKQLHPLVDESKILGALMTVGDGFIDTGKLSNALAAGARKYGAKVIEHCSVEKTVQRSDGYWDVVTNKGTIKTRHLINAAGLWARDIGRKVGLDLPLVCVQHQYAFTSAISALGAHQQSPLPVLHDPDGSYYCRQEESGILFGAFEKSANVRLLKNWYKDGMPQDLSKDPLTADFSQIAENFETAKGIIPELAKVKIENTYSRVLCMSPDGLPLLGPVDGAINYWLAGGFSDGIAVGGGIGMYLAKWIMNEEPPFELTTLEPNRFQHWAFKRRNYIFDKTAETYSLWYANVWHKPDRPAGRPTDRISGIYGALLQKGGHMAFRCGWEQPTWFKQPGHSGGYKEAVNRECEMVLNRGGVIDLSLYGKIEVQGEDATKFINYAFTVSPPQLGRIAVGQMLTPTGNILSRMRMTHHNKQKVEYLLLTRPEQEQRDLKWLENIARVHQFKIELNNVTEYLAAIAIVGPRSRDAISWLTKEDLSDEAFPYKATRLARMAGNPVIVCRDSTTGELGYQIFHNRADSLRLYEALMKVGEQYGIGDFGRWAFNTLRTEKGVKFWGHELTLDYTPVEAGIMDKIDLKKEDFIGLAALKEMLNKEPEKKLHMFSAENTDVNGDPVKMYPDGMEAVWQNDKIVGHVTSGCFSYTLQAPLGFAYISTKLPYGSDPLTVDILGRQVKAKLLDKPPAIPHHRRSKEQQQA